MGSGLIYAAIIVLWLLYFVPRWLRRHEELSEARSVEKFDHAMRVLSRREPTPDQRYVVMPARPDAADRPPLGRTPVPADPPRPRRSDASVDLDGRADEGPAGRRARSIAVRRRRVLAVLLLATALVAAAAPLTPAPWWVPVLLLTVSVGYLVHLRLQEHRRHQVSRTRDQVRRRTDSRLRRLDSQERLAQARAVLGEQRAAAEAARVEQEWAAHEAARRAASRPVPDDGGWQPTPVPLPTYVTKPRAPRTSRPIDLTRPGTWSDLQVPGGQEPFDQTLDEPVVVPQPGSAAHDATGAAVASAAAREAAYEELDAILERRRAVND